MKKTVLLIFLSLLAIISIDAQPYQPCLDDGMVRWSMLDYHVSDAGLISTEIIAFGDTTINDLPYKKMYYSPWGYPIEKNDENWKNFIPELTYYMLFSEYFFIRESEDASRLYLYNSRWDEEYLISDMNLQKGDEFQFNYQNYRVDSVYIKNDLKHIQMDREIWSPAIIYQDTLKLIEGVGPNIWPLNPEESYGALNCFHNQTLFYKYDNGYPCGYEAPPNNIKTVSNGDYHFRITAGDVNVYFSFPSRKHISISDISGRLRYSQVFLSGENATIPIASFPKGVYLLKIEDQDKKQTKVYKFIL
jgi:hypothetical protein